MILTKMLRDNILYLRPHNINSFANPSDSNHGTYHGTWRRLHLLRCNGNSLTRRRMSTRIALYSRNSLKPLFKLYLVSHA